MMIQLRIHACSTAQMFPYFTNYVNLPQSFICPWVDFDYFVARSRMCCFAVNEFSFFFDSIQVTTVEVSVSNVYP